MNRVFAILLPLAFAAISTSSCVDGDLEDPATASSCAPGRQASCACGGGVEGFQVCKDDGSGYGACVCSDTGLADVSTDTGTLDDVATDTTIAATDTGSAMMDTIVADTTPSVDTAPVDTATGPKWVWIDRGGPAFQPSACPDGPGVSGGKLVDPEAFFKALIAGKAAKDWVTVMNDIEKSLWACGVGQQRGSGGDVRGRLFLPTAACPDASPPAGDALAIKLGVRQLPECWTHAVDVVEG
jgi:hypothetical protein